MDSTRQTKQRKHRATPGFTLVEMLVAMAIFAVVGLISSQLVSEVLYHQEAATVRGQRLSDLQRALQILQRDVVAVVNRGVRDQLGDPLPPLLIHPDGMLEMTRTGWRNPLNLPRAELQRVSYVLSDETLNRVYWPVLDRGPDTEPVQQELLTNVEAVEFFALDVSGNEHGFWPLATSGGPVNPATQLIAIGVRFTAVPWGNIERLWIVPRL